MCEPVNMFRRYQRVDNSFAFVLCSVPDYSLQELHKGKSRESGQNRASLQMFEHAHSALVRGSDRLLTDAEATQQTKQTTRKDRSATVAHHYQLSVQSAQIGPRIRRRGAS